MYKEKENSIFLKFLTYFAPLFVFLMFIAFFLLFEGSITFFQNILYVRPNHATLLWLESSYTLQEKASMFFIAAFLVTFYFMNFFRTNPTIKHRAVKKTILISCAAALCLGTTLCYVISVRNYAYCTENKIVFRHVFGTREEYDLDYPFYVYTNTRESHSKYGSTQQVIYVLRFLSDEKIHIRDIKPSYEGIGKILEYNHFGVQFDTPFAEESFNEKYKKAKDFNR